MSKRTLREAIATVKQTIAAQKDNAPQDAQNGVDSMGISDPEEYELYETDDAELEDTDETPCEAGSWRIRGNELQVDVNGELPLEESDEPVYPFPWPLGVYYGYHD